MKPTKRASGAKTSGTVTVTAKRSRREVCLTSRASQYFNSLTTTAATSVAHSLPHTVSSSSAPVPPPYASISQYESLSQPFQGAALHAKPQATASAVAPEDGLAHVDIHASMDPTYYDVIDSTHNVSTANTDTLSANHSAAVSPTVPGSPMRPGSPSLIIPLDSGIVNEPVSPVDDNVRTTIDLTLFPVSSVDTHSTGVPLLHNIGLPRVPHAIATAAPAQTAVSRPGLLNFTSPSSVAVSRPGLAQMPHTSMQMAVSRPITTPVASTSMQSAVSRHLQPIPHGVDFVPPQTMSARSLAAYQNASANSLFMPTATSGLRISQQDQLNNAQQQQLNHGTYASVNSRVVKPGEPDQISELSRSLLQMQDAFLASQKATSECLSNIMTKLNEVSARPPNVLPNVTQPMHVSIAHSFDTGLPTVALPSFPSHNTMTTLATSTTIPLAHTPVSQTQTSLATVQLPTQVQQGRDSHLHGVMYEQMNRLLTGAGLRQMQNSPLSQPDFSQLSHEQAGEILSALTRPVEPRRVVTAGLPLGTTVDIRIKQKIWSEQWVDFEDLLLTDSRSKYSLKHATDDGFQIVKYDRKISSISQWSQAFDVFVAVYIQHPQLVKHLPELLTYGREVKRLADKGLNFLLYDELFRRERASMLQPYSWASFRQDLYHEAVIADSGINRNDKQSRQNQPSSAAGQSNSTQSNSSKKKSVYVPRGYCIAFHSSGQRCAANRDCTYNHTCFKCKKSAHPQFMCRNPPASDSKSDDKPNNKDSNNRNPSQK